MSEKTQREKEQKPLRRIKSYALRSGKISALQKRSLEKLSPLYCIPLSDEPLDFIELFGHDREIVLEVGFGMGHATAEIAEIFPEKGFIGVEVHLPGVGKLLSEIERRKLSNIRIIQADIVDVLAKMIPDESLAGVHIFFPDPWPKKRHRKRRLFSGHFAETLSGKLLKGGYIYLVTDIEDYAEQMLSAGNSTDWLENRFNGYADPPGFRPVTAFERKAAAENRQVREIILTRK